MKVETLRKIAREYREVAERKLDDKELCKGFSDLCREEGISWTQLRGLVDAETADGRDGGDRVGKIVEKADFASSYADLLYERKREIRSSSSVAPVAPQAPVDAIQRDPAPRTVLREQLIASVALADAGEIPGFLDRRRS